MDIDIRLLSLSDHDRVLRLWQSTPGVGLREADDCREGFERLLRRNPSTCFGAFRDDLLVGTILAGNDGRRGYLYHLAVAPGERRKGIGSCLVRTVMEALKAEGIRKTALVVFTDNAGGNAFWEAAGFTERTDLVYRNMENK